MNTFWAFVPIALIFGVTPGPDATLAIRSSLANGTTHGVAVALGAATGSLAWGFAAAVGVASFVTNVPAAFEILRWGGAAYLVFLGVQTISSAGSWVVPGEVTSQRTRGSVKRAFATGIIADLLNPKMGVFYLAVIPQFIPKDGPIFAWSMLLMGIEFVIAVICLSLYAVLASSIRGLLSRGTIGVWMDRVLGMVLLALAFE